MPSDVILVARKMRGLRLLGGIGRTPKEVLTGDAQGVENIAQDVGAIHPVIQVFVHAIRIEFEVVVQHLGEVGKLFGRLRRNEQ
jgi:hypothetical protein